MWPFKEKKLYRLTWSYSEGGYKYIEVIRAYNPAHAWKIIKRDHPLAITLVQLEEVRS